MPESPNDTRYIYQRPNGHCQVNFPAGIAARLGCHTLGTYADLPAAQAARDEALAKLPPPAPRSPSAPPTARPEEDGPGATTDHLTDTTDGNHRAVTYVSPDVRTLADLIRECHIDETVWRITRWEANKWPVGAKLAKRSLTWSDGRIEEGTLEDDGKLTVAPLFQVKAWMVRLEPIPITPAVQPVHITVTPCHPEAACHPEAGSLTSLHHTPPQAEGSLSDPQSLVTRALILADAQIGFRRHPHTGALTPFHDRAALDVALQIAQAGGFDRIIVAGDWLDLTEFTDKFVREKEFYFTTQPAIDEAAWWLAQFARLAPTDFIEGNHEQRLPIALNTHLLAAYGIHPADEISLPPPLTVPAWLGFDARNITWHPGYPNNALYLTDALRIVHGDVAKSTPGATAAAYLDAPVSTIFAHIHRCEAATRTELHRSHQHPITSLCPGCLCRVDGAVPGHTQRQNWQQGIAVAAYTPAGYVALNTIPIHRGQAVYNGRLFTASDPLPRLRTDTNCNF